MKNFAVGSAFFAVLVSWAVITLANMPSGIASSDTMLLNYVEELIQDLGILQDQNVRFVFDQGEIKLHTFMYCI